MAGFVKRKIRQAREAGNDELAAWFEAKEASRLGDVPMWKWMKENPKPGDETINKIDGLSEPVKKKQTD